jgi:hypothetical protein
MAQTGNWVSPRFKDTEFSDPPTDDDKIAVFEDRVDGWQLRIAEELLRQIEIQQPPPMQHAGYALISVLFPYFEMIGQILKKQAGEKTGATGDFVRGFKQVFPTAALTDPEIEIVYDRIRCGMFHNGYTKKGVYIDGEYTEVFEYKNGVVQLNPHLLVPAIRSHFATLAALLKDKANTEERSRFIDLFDRVGKS